MERLDRHRGGQGDTDTGRGSAPSVKPPERANCPTCIRKPTSHQSRGRGHDSGHLHCLNYLNPRLCKFRSVSDPSYDDKRAALCTCVPPAPNQFSPTKDPPRTPGAGSSTTVIPASLGCTRSTSYKVTTEIDAPKKECRGVSQGQCLRTTIRHRSQHSQRTRLGTYLYVCRARGATRDYTTRHQDMLAADGSITLRVIVMEIIAVIMIWFFDFINLGI